MVVSACIKGKNIFKHGAMSRISMNGKEIKNAPPVNVGFTPDLTIINQLLTLWRRCKHSQIDRTIPPSTIHDNFDFIPLSVHVFCIDYKRSNKWPGHCLVLPEFLNSIAFWALVNSESFRKNNQSVMLRRYEGERHTSFSFELELNVSAAFGVVDFWLYNGVSTRYNDACASANLWLEGRS